MFCCERAGYHRDLHSWTHSCPTRRAADLRGRLRRRLVRLDRGRQHIRWRSGRLAAGKISRQFIGDDARRRKPLFVKWRRTEGLGIEAGDVGDLRFDRKLFLTYRMLEGRAPPPAARPAIDDVAIDRKSTRLNSRH